MPTEEQVVAEFELLKKLDEVLGDTQRRGRRRRPVADVDGNRASGQAQNVVRRETDRRDAPEGSHSRGYMSVRQHEGRSFLDLVSPELEPEPRLFDTLTFYDPRLAHKSELGENRDRALHSHRNCRRKSDNNVTLVPQGFLNDATILPRIEYESLVSEGEETMMETALAPIIQKYVLAASPSTVITPTSSSSFTSFPSSPSPSHRPDLTANSPPRPIPNTDWPSPRRNDPDPLPNRQHGHWDDSWSHSVWAEGGVDRDRTRRGRADANRPARSMAWWTDSEPEAPRRATGRDNPPPLLDRDGDGSPLFSEHASSPFLVDDPVLVSRGSRRVIEGERQRTGANTGRDRPAAPRGSGRNTDRDGGG
ncbi:hypothetical protein BC936DRAFT_142610, partial [Jimgerdemannia flammicorona]